VSTAQERGPRDRLRRPGGVRARHVKLATCGPDEITRLADGLPAPDAPPLLVPTCSWHLDRVPAERRAPRRAGPRSVHRDRRGRETAATSPRDARSLAASASPRTTSRCGLLNKDGERYALTADSAASSTGARRRCVPPRRNFATRPSCAPPSPRGGDLRRGAPALPGGGHREARSIRYGGFARAMAPDAGRGARGGGDGRGRRGAAAPGARRGGRARDVGYRVRAAVSAAEVAGLDWGACSRSRERLFPRSAGVEAPIANFEGSAFGRGPDRALRPDPRPQFPHPLRPRRPAKRVLARARAALHPRPRVDGGVRPARGTGSRPRRDVRPGELCTTPAGDRLHFAELDSMFRRADSARASCASGARRPQAHHLQRWGGFHEASDPGDSPETGIGKEVLPEGIRVLEAAGAASGWSSEWTHFDWSCEVYAAPGA